MTTPAAVRATFADFRLVKTRKLAQLVLEIPIEQADAALRVLGGLPRSDMERWVAVALLLEPDALAAPWREPDVAEEADRQRRRRNSKEAYQAKPEVQQAVTRAAMMVKDEQYQDWISALDANDADKLLKICCDISSKAQIGTDPEAYKRFIAHELAFRHAMEEPAA